MNPLSYPDIAGMLILMGLLLWMRSRYRETSVDLWLIGLFFILIEALAYGVIRDGSHGFPRTLHVIALDAYLFAAVSFGWAAGRDIFPFGWRVPLILPPALPLLLLATLYGTDIKSFLPYLLIASATLIAGLVAIPTVKTAANFRLRWIAAHLVLWVPIIVMASQGQLRFVVYWGLACLYTLVGLSFRFRIRRDGVGGVVLAAGFAFWACCFLAHPFVRNHALADAIVEQMWNMQKFFVIIGMILVLLEEQTSRRESEAMLDALTGLPNRRLFDDRLAQSVARATRTGLSSAILVLDLDGFKQVNDTCGHAAGDIVLAHVAQALKSKVRSSDTLARCGGDEFCVVVNDLTRREDCERIATALRAAVLGVPLPPQCFTPMRVSIGYAVFPQDTSAANLFHLADERMYQDKRTGSLEPAPSVTVNQESVILSEAGR